MKGRIKWIFLLDLLTAAIGLGIDQVTKWLAVVHLKGKPAFILLPGVLEFNYLENRGAAFGLLQNRQTFFIITTLFVLAIILYVLLKMPEGKKYFPLHLSGGILLAGALGNFIDRVRLDYVIDFIYIKVIDFPVFNVADMYVSLICAAGLVLVFFGNYKEEDFSFLRCKKSWKGNR